MEFSRQEYWSGVPFPPPGDHPDPGVEPISFVFCIGKQILYPTATWEATAHLTILKILGPLRIMLKLLCLCSINGTTELG